MVEDSGIAPLTSWMQIRRSPSWANPPINWWAEKDSNFRPHTYQGCALPTELPAPMQEKHYFKKRNEDGQHYLYII